MTMYDKTKTSLELISGVGPTQALPSNRSHSSQHFLVQMDKLHESWSPEETVTF